MYQKTVSFVSEKAAIMELYCLVLSKFAFASNLSHQNTNVNTSSHNHKKCRSAMEMWQKVDSIKPTNDESVFFYPLQWRIQFCKCEALQLLAKESCVKLKNILSFYYKPTRETRKVLKVGVNQCSKSASQNSFELTALMLETMQAILDDKNSN